jgi:phosphoribosylformimino-5-aminoimidazole carboxamide ribotide isomerase
MTVWAAVDLRGGRVVQLVGGRPEEERLSHPDPVAVAAGWAAQGFRGLHVVDLDAALGTGNNRATIAAILEAVDVPVQVGGGVRDTPTADWLIERGAARVVVGTRALQDRPWLEHLATRLGGRVVVAADMRQGQLTTHGWTRQVELECTTFLPRLDALDLAAVLVTDVSREGRMTGADIQRFAALTRCTRHPLLAAGGIAGAEDLRALAQVGVAGVVVGMALYTGALAPGAGQREFR